MQPPSSLAPLRHAFWLLCLLALLTALATPAQAQGGKRVALVIGNAAYADRPLRNPVNDANLMQTTLRGLGFEVTLLRNTDRRGLLAGLRDFEAKARDADVALFFFAGHGAQIDGSNYLLPLNAQINSPTDLPDEAVDAVSVLRRLEDARAKVALVILDACRDNPYPNASRSASRGLARMNVPTGSIVAYATAPGSVAADGAGSNGVYTEQLARHLAQPGLDLRDVFDRTASEVERITGGKQRPREDVGLRGRFVLAPGGQVASVVPEPVRPSQPVQPAPATASTPLPTAPTWSASNTPQEMVVKIAHVGPLSGSIAHLGKDNENGAKLAIEELNARGVQIGGVKVKLELVSEDDAADPRQGVSVAKKLVDMRVAAVIGHLNSGTSIPASKIYSDAGIPQVTPSATNPRFTRNGYKTTFRMVADDVALPSTLGRYVLTTMKPKAVAVIDDRTAYGAGIADEFEKAVKAAGGKIVSREFTSDKATDFTAILSAIKLKEPDVIFFGGMDSTAGPMLRQMRSMGIRARLVGGDGICSSELVRLAGDGMGDGQVICAEAGGVSGNEAQALERFYKSFKQRFQTDVQVYAPYVYDAVTVVVAAMVKAGSSDPARYLPALAATNYTGVTGNISFDDRGDLKAGAITLYTYKQGRRDLVGVLR